ncbi:MAG: hypothetical protein M3424_01370 [Actinomycetota bacterium]|nr:hypothetical protein [Actinomycetota bacterium]
MSIFTPAATVQQGDRIPAQAMIGPWWRLQRTAPQVLLECSGHPGATLAGLGRLAHRSPCR